MFPKKIGVSCTGVGVQGVGVECFTKYFEKIFKTLFMVCVKVQGSEVQGRGCKIFARNFENIFHTPHPPPQYPRLIVDGLLNSQFLNTTKIIKTLHAIIQDI